MRFIVFLLTTCFCILCPSINQAQTVGDLDPVFGEKGFVWLDMGSSKDNVQRIALQVNGKILIAGGERSEKDGGFFVTRLSANGQLDPSFGKWGEKKFDLEGELRDIKALADGKILITGYINKGPDKDFVILRLLPNGDLDTDFAEGGKRVINLGGTDEARAIGIQKDGSLIIAGNTYAQSWVQRDFALVKLFENGELDYTFGNGGIKRIDIDKYDSFRDLAIKPDGKIVVAGYTKPDNFTQYAIFQLDETGNLDPSFDLDGVKLMQPGLENNFCQGMAIQADGRILLGGHAKSQKGRHGFDFIVTRLESDGLIDYSYGQGGKVVIDLGGTEYASSLFLQKDQNLMLVGSSNHKLTAIRLTSKGSLDRSFGQNGVRIIQTEKYSNDRACDLIVQPDDKILLAGVNQEKCAIIRLEGNPHLIGLEQVMDFKWEKSPQNKRRYAGLELAEKFQIRAWVEGEYIPKASDFAFPNTFSGPQSLSPVGNSIVKRMYLAVGEKYQLTIIWDSADQIHFFANGTYAYTHSMQLWASGPKKPVEEIQKPLQTH